MSTESSATSDTTMEAISAAVSLGRVGAVETARRDLLAIWRQVGAVGDAFHRCTLAHYLADLYENPAESLVWDIRAIDAADALTDERAQAHDASLHVRGFYPSLFLNLADNFRRLGAFETAAAHIDEAEKHTSVLSEGAYGESIRTAIRQVADAITAQDTSRRVSAPGPGR